MNRRNVLIVMVALLLVLPAVAGAQKGGPPGEHPGNKDPLAATPNLAFPVIATDIIQMFYLQTWVDADGDGVVDDSEWVLDYDLDDDGINEMTEPTPIEVTEVISDQYGGSFDGYTVDDAERGETTRHPFWLVGDHHFQRGLGERDCLAADGVKGGHVHPSANRNRGRSTLE